jgi:hypothetical protein
MTRDVNYIIKLKDEVTNEMLKEKGFKIEESKNFLWAIKEGSIKNSTRSEKGKTIIIKLSPPERIIAFRYQSDYLGENLIEETGFMKELYTVTFL